MNIHADDIGLSIVVPGSSLVVHTYTLLLYMLFLHGARARHRLITELVSFHELWKRDYWKFKYENASPAKTSIMFHQPITR